MYYAKSIDGKKTIQFHGETLVCNNPHLIDYLIDAFNKKTDGVTICKKDYQIIEVNMEMIDNVVHGMEAKNENKRNKR